VKIWYAYFVLVLAERKLTLLKFGAVLIAMLASTIPVSILGVQFAMRVFPFWSPGQFSEYLFLLPGSLLFLRSFIHGETDPSTHSPGRWYAVRTRDSGRLGVAELYSKGTRVRYLTHH
jgi:hypothetical protein